MYSLIVKILGLRVLLFSQAGFLAQPVAGTPIGYNSNHPVVDMANQSHILHGQPFEFSVISFKLLLQILCFF
jgi:hypothetical protein